MKTIKKVYSGIFRDGGAGNQAKRRYRERRRKLMDKEGSLIAITGVPYGPGGKTGMGIFSQPNLSRTINDVFNRYKSK